MLFKYGRGMEADIRYEKFGMGAFFLNTAWGEPKEREIGTHVGYRFGEWLEIKGNFLNRRILEKEFSDNIFSIEAKGHQAKWLELDLECGFGQSDREKKVHDYAYRMDLRGQFSDSLQYSFEKAYAGPGFFGSFRKT